VASEALTREAAARLEQLILAPSSLSSPSDDLAGMFADDQMRLRALPESASVTDRADFVRGAGAALADEFNPLPGFRDLAAQGASIRIRVARRGGLPVARLRIVHGTGMFSFVDLLFGVTVDGAQVVDLFRLATGRWQSEEAAELFAQDYLGHGQASARSGSGADDAESILELTRLCLQERWSDALAVYDAMPRELQRSPEVFDLRLAAASRADGGAHYREVLEDYLALFPDDGGASLRRYELALLRGEWTAALDALGTLRMLFPDPYWVGREADIELRREGYLRALVLSEQLIDADPSLIEGPQYALFASLMLERDADAGRYAAMLRDHHSVSLEALAASPGYRPLAAVDVPAPTTTE
jgi:hypothetical protein